MAALSGGGGDEADFAKMILETLPPPACSRHTKEDRITFTSIAPWPGHFYRR